MFSVSSRAVVTCSVLLIAVTLLPSLGDALEDRIAPIATIGSGVMLEKDNDNSVQTTRLPMAIGAGAGYLNWTARVEYQSYKSADGNSTVSVAREHEVLQAWATYAFKQFEGWRPYLALGTGFGRTTVETRFLSTNEKTKGGWDGMLALAGGCAASWTPTLVVRPEFRYETADGYKLKDARMGAFISLDYLF